jgi:hypothetical protein
MSFASFISIPVVVPIPGIRLRVESWSLFGSEKRRYCGTCRQWRCSVNRRWKGECIERLLLFRVAVGCERDKSSDWLDIRCVRCRTVKEGLSFEKAVQG